MPLPALQLIERDLKSRSGYSNCRSGSSEEDRAAHSALRAEEGAFEQKIEQQFDAHKNEDRAEARAAEKKDRDADPPLRAEERHPPRRRSPLHPLLDREAAGDRRGHAVRQGAGAHHGALCRSGVDGPVIELGPGTGPVTEALVEHGVDPARLVLVEFNPHFCRLLRSAIPKRRWCRAMPTACERLLAGLAAASRPRRWCPACR